MEVILTEDVPKLGEMGELVSVAPGYGRNYLIPRGLAIPATSSKKAEIKHQLAKIDRRKEQEREAAQGIYKELNGVAVTAAKRVSDGDDLYGSVSDREVVELLAQQGHEVERRQVVLEQPITQLGIYRVPIKLASGIYADVDVWVVSL